MGPGAHTPEGQSSDGQSLESAMPKEAPAPTFPEGGLKAWSVALGCFCIMFVTFGYLNAFGVYEAYYIRKILPDKSPSAIAWIGSLQLFFQFSAGLISGPVTDRWGPRVILIPATVLYATSVMLTSVCKEYYQFILAQGVLGGLTNGLAYAPAIAIIGQYFHKKRALAMGIASSGSSLGGVIFPIMLNRLFNHSSVGFGWAVRITGFLILALALIAVATVVPRFPPRVGKYLLLEAFKQPTYSIQVAGIFLVIWGLLTPFFYLPTFAEAHGISLDLSIYVLAILNAASVFGRLLTGPASTTLGRFNTLTLASLICSILVFCWLRITSLASIIVFSVLYGFFSGFIVALFPATLAQVARHPSEIGSYLGMALGIYGIAGLTGTPITGAMISHYNGYDEAIIFSGSVMIAGTVLVFIARLFATGKVLMVVA
ncbi:hypothetical protein MBLNU459_g5997t1 [Dothideomycetes sp. NU459]